MDDNYQIKIHEKLYVGFRRGGGNSMPVGMMTTVDHTKAYEKRKDNIDYWAKYGNGDKKPFDGVIIENKPMIGFRISRAQRNAGWHISMESIRVEDPRGFEVDITLANMLMLTDNNLIENGELLRECIWGKDGNTNVLLPVNSVPYQQAFTNTERQKTHVNVRQLERGAHVVLKNGYAGRYLGRLYAATVTHNGGRYSYNSQGATYTIGNSEEKPIHYIQVEQDSTPGMTPKYKYMGFASPNVSRIEKLDPMTAAEVNDLLYNEYLAGMDRDGGKCDPIMLFTEPPKLSACFKPADITDIVVHSDFANNRGRWGFTGKFYAKPPENAAYQKMALSYNVFRSNSAPPASTTFQTADFADDNLSAKLSGEYKAASVNLAGLEFEQLELTFALESTGQTFTIKL